MTAPNKLRDRLRFPVGGRSVRRVRQDAKSAAQDSGVPYTRELTKLARMNGCPMSWNRAMEYLEQYDRVSQVQGSGLPEYADNELMSAPGRITLITGDSGTSLHSATREWLGSQMMEDDSVTAVVYRDRFLTPGRNANLGLETFWFRGAEVGDVLNNEQMSTQEAMALADEMIHAGNRINSGIDDFNEWRTDLMKRYFIHSSNQFPGEKFRWSDSVLYVASTPNTLRETTEALTAAQLGAKTILINSYASSWDHALTPDTWGLTDKDPFLMKELLSRVDTVLHRTKAHVSTEGVVMGHSIATVTPQTNAALDQGGIDIHEWREIVGEGRSSYSQDIEYQITAGTVPEVLGISALEQLEVPAVSQSRKTDFTFQVA